LQPDSIIPNPANPQSWNRYSYVENDPINYSDTSGHFKCKNESYNAAYNGSNCEAAIESFLTLLVEEGGEEGKALVDAFRNADTVACKGRMACTPMKDQISITIVNVIENEGQPTNATAQFTSNFFGVDQYLMTVAVMGEEPLITAAKFGHETVHLTQGLQGGTLLAELEAWHIESQIYANMGLSSSSNSNVITANIIASYIYESKEEIENSDWAYQYGLPFSNIFTPKWRPSIRPPRPVIPQHQPI